MTDTKCPHCGAEKDSHYTTPTRFDCGTIAWTQSVMQTQYCELRCLRAKVAAQQELLIGILKCHTSIGTQTVTAVLPLDMWEQIEWEQIELDAYS